jgi:hypothetical protein
MTYKLLQPLFDHENPT